MITLYEKVYNHATKKTFGGWKKTLAPRRQKYYLFAKSY